MVRYRQRKRWHKPSLSKHKSVMVFGIIITILAYSSGFAQENKKLNLSGYVRDAASGESLIGAAIRIRETGIGAYTNEYGFYSLSIPKGTYTIEISYVGYEQVLQTLSISQNEKRDIAIKEVSTTLTEVNIVAQSSRPNVLETQMSRNEIQIETIKRIPALLGETDVLKALQLLPGIQSAGDGNAGFYVRGGTVDQNLILLDEAPVFNSSHLLGFFSVFNTDAIKSIEIYRGAIPARYGGRLSSLVDIRMREGNNQRLGIEGGIGLISSRLTIEGPIAKNKASFIVSARRTYVDLFLRASSDPAVRSNSLYFYDFNAKLNWQVSARDQLFVSGYFGRDVLKFGSLFGNSWGNATATFRWNHLFSDKIFSNTTLIYSDFDYTIRFSAGEDSGAEVKAGIKNYVFKNDYSFFINDKIKLYSGIIGTWYIFDLGSVTPIGSKSFYKPFSTDKQQALEGAGYIDIEQTLTKRIQLRYGLRYSYFGLYGPGKRYTYASDGQTPTDTTYYSAGKLIQDYGGFEPRFQIRISTDDYSSVKAGYSRTRQYIHLASNSTASLPTDLWIPSGTVVKPQIADQYSLGYFRDFFVRKYTASVELYYKNMYNQIDFRDGAQLYLNELLESQVLSGQGFSYGAEFFIQKTEGKTTGWISYTLAWARRRIPGINGGEEYAAKNDKRHNLNVVATHKFSDRWEAGAIFTYSTGAAVSFPATKYYIEGQPVALYSERNGYRLPDYHRLDFSLTYKPKPKPDRRFHSEWNLSVYNVYGQKNPYFINFRQNKDRPQETEVVLIYLFSVIPTVTWNFKF